MAFPICGACRCAELEEVVVEETEDQAMAKKMAAIFNPPKPHAHRPKRVYHRRGHNPYHP